MTAVIPGDTPVPPGPPVLELRDVWAGYGETTVLRGVDITVPRSSVLVTPYASHAKALGSLSGVRIGIIRESMLIRPGDKAGVRGLTRVPLGPQDSGATTAAPVSRIGKRSPTRAIRWAGGRASTSASCCANCCAGWT